MSATVIGTLRSLIVNGTLRSLVVEGALCSLVVNRTWGVTWTLCPVIALLLLTGVILAFLITAFLRVITGRCKIWACIIRTVGSIHGAVGAFVKIR